MKTLVASVLLTLAGTSYAQESQSSTTVFSSVYSSLVALSEPNSPRGLCGAVALDPHHILTATHCMRDNIFVPLVNDVSTKIVEIADDSDRGGDSIILYTPNMTFANFAKVAPNTEADYGEEVFVWGRPIGFDWMLRKGYRVGIWDKQVSDDNFAPPHVYQSYNLDLINGDSGNPIFNMKGEIVATVSGSHTWVRYSEMDGSVSKTLKLSFSTPYRFSKEEWAQAGVIRE